MLKIIGGTSRVNTILEFIFNFESLKLYFLWFPRSLMFSLFKSWFNDKQLNTVCWTLIISFEGLFRYPEVPLQLNINIFFYYILYSYMFGERLLTCLSLLSENTAFTLSGWTTKLMVIRKMHTKRTLCPNK